MIGPTKVRFILFGSGMAADLMRLPGRSALYAGKIEWRVVFQRDREGEWMRLPGRSALHNGGSCFGATANQEGWRLPGHVTA